MFFSVLIPVYNTSQYLDECINSVLNQTEKDYEIVLVDDGSTDKSGDICDSYAKKYSFIRVIHKQNEGLMMTRRRGFKEAKGEYFICLDSDDYLCDNKALYKIRKLIEEKNCDLVLYNYYMEKEPGMAGKDVVLFDEPDGYVFKDKAELYSKLLVGAFLNPMCIKAVKKNVVDVNVDYSSYKDSLPKSQGEDLLQSFPILNNAQKIGYINQSFYFYRFNGGSISNNMKPEFYYAYRTIYYRAKKYIKLWNIDKKIQEEHKKKYLNTVLTIIISSYNVFESVNEWKRFVLEISGDEFFSEISKTAFKSRVSKYYRICNFFVSHKKPGLLEKVINKVSRQRG